MHCLLAQLYDWLLVSARRGTCEKPLGCGRERLSGGRRSGGANHFDVAAATALALVAAGPTTTTTETARLQPPETKRKQQQQELQQQRRSPELGRLPLYHLCVCSVGATRMRLGKRLIAVDLSFRTDNERPESSHTHLLVLGKFKTRTQMNRRVKPVRNETKHRTSLTYAHSQTFKLRPRSLPLLLTHSNCFNSTFKPALLFAQKRSLQLSLSVCCVSYVCLCVCVCV